jgi:hypothetical protein
MRATESAAVMHPGSDRCSTLADAAAIQLLDRRNGTVFVVHNGPKDASLQVAPQLAQSIFYLLPGMLARFFGNSEVAYRIPSVLAMAAALFFVFRLAVRSIHPEAGWFAVFACLSLRGINYQAADARPYALGTCIAAGSLLPLIRWLDSGQSHGFVIYGGITPFGFGANGRRLRGVIGLA